MRREGLYQSDVNMWKRWSERWSVETVVRLTVETVVSLMRGRFSIVTRCGQACNFPGKTRADQAGHVFPRFSATFFPAWHESRPRWPVHLEDHRPAVCRLPPHDSRDDAGHRLYAIWIASSLGIDLGRQALQRLKNVLKFGSCAEQHDLHLVVVTFEVANLRRCGREQFQRAGNGKIVASPD